MSVVSTACLRAPHVLLALSLTSVGARAQSAARTAGRCAPCGVLPPCPLVAL